MSESFYILYDFIVSANAFQFSMPVHFSVLLASFLKTVATLKTFNGRT